MFNQLININNYYYKLFLYFKLGITIICIVSVFFRSLTEHCNFDQLKLPCLVSDEGVIVSGEGESVHF